MNFFIILLLISPIFTEYSVGDEISMNDQNTSFDICYGDYQAEQLSLSDFADGNKVIWLNLAASW